MGFDDIGRKIAGVETGYNFNDTKVYVDISTKELLNDNTVYNPGEIEFSLGIQTPQVSYEHICIHGINDYKPIEISDSVYINIKL